MKSCRETFHMHLKAKDSIVYARNHRKLITTCCRLHKPNTTIRSRANSHDSIDSRIEVFACRAIIDVNGESSTGRPIGQITPPHRFRLRRPSCRREAEAKYEHEKARRAISQSFHRLSHFFLLLKSGSKCITHPAAYPQAHALYQRAGKSAIGNIKGFSLCELKSQMRYCNARWTPQLFIYVSVLKAYIVKTYPEGSDPNAANLRRYVFIMCQKAIIYEIMSRNISYALES